FTFLNKREPFISELVAVISDQMGDFFPEIRQQQTLVTNVSREEEAAFLRTLDQGLQLLDAVVQNTSGDQVSDELAFDLYDTFGFPKDLTALILKERGMQYAEAGFDKAMQAQKSRSRAASEVATGDWTVLMGGNIETFVGYDTLVQTSRISRYRVVDSKKDGKMFQIVLDSTPFYPEGGGQVGDRGWLISGSQRIEVLDTKKENNLILHFTKLLPSDLHAPIQAEVSSDLRAK